MNYVFDELKQNSQFDLLFTEELCKVSYQEAMNNVFVSCQQQQP